MRRKLMLAHLRSRQIMVLSVAIISFFIYSCSKENKTSAKPDAPPLSNTDIMTVRSYLQNAESDADEKDKPLLASLAKNLAFAQAQSADFGNGKELISIPITSGVQRGIVVKVESVPGAATLSRLLVFRDQNGAIQLANVVQLTPAGTATPIGNASQLISELFHYGKPNTSYSGYFTSMSLNGDIDFEMKFDHGRKLSFTQKVTKPSGVRVAFEQQDQQTCTIWSVTTTYYDGDGNILSQSTSVIGEFCNSGGGGGGGGGGGNPSNPSPKPTGVFQCYYDELANFQSESGGATVASMTTGMDVGNVDALTKYKNPSWIILTGLGGWTLVSHETGIVKLTSVANNTWSWQSLAHAGISMAGSTLPGVSVSYDAGFGTPSFTPGSGGNNTFYAGMSLDFTVTYSFVCDCPMTKGLVPSVSKAYTSTAIWDADPSH